MNKLLALNWICLPEGDAGGRSNALKYHLHPDGCPCGLPKVELKHRTVLRKRMAGSRVKCNEDETVIVTAI